MKRMQTWRLALAAAVMAGAVTVQAQGNLRYSITVSKFPNEAGW